mmetsp:Transcript_12466/g.43635  ORF Transcript_12466/g.43635 Transcript_12466/m.43635 type:complete len:202 (-) Transcript_12466:564-1169(-)
MSSGTIGFGDLPSLLYLPGIVRVPRLESLAAAAAAVLVVVLGVVAALPPLYPKLEPLRALVTRMSVSRSCSRLKGLRSTSLNPAARYRSTSSSIAFPVTATIGGNSPPPARSLRHTASPLVRCMMMSSRITSTACAPTPRSALSTSSPSSNIVTPQPSASRCRSSTRRLTRSSSAHRQCRLSGASAPDADAGSGRRAAPGA